MKLVREKDITTIANIAKSTTNWTIEHYPIDIGTLSDFPGLLHVEAGRSTGASRDPQGEEIIFEEVEVAVKNEITDEIFKLTIEDCTIEEAVDMIYAARPTSLPVTENNPLGNKLIISDHQP
tara:strand:- start:448 stop:813 length:366 start_codon:yes stop_codon:yes gene_type:complete